MDTRPFDDIRALVESLPGPAAAPAPPRRGLGRLEETALWLAAWTGRTPPSVNRPIIAIYAGAHGVAAHIDAGPPVRGLLEAMAAGLAPVSVLAQAQGAGLDAYDLAVDRPVGDITARAAMSEKECAATMAFGMEALAKQPDLLVVGEAGAGGDIAAAAVAQALFGGQPRDWTDHPDLVGRAVVRAREEGADAPLDLLRQLGGREMAAIAGAILAARTQKTPVLLDSYAACAAAAVLQALRPDALDHCLAAHVSTLAGHAILLEHLGKTPLLDLSIAAGAGTGGAAAIGLVRLASACFQPR